jgi:hypothetical protein
MVMSLQERTMVIVSLGSIWWGEHELVDKQKNSKVMASTYSLKCTLLMQTSKGGPKKLNHQDLNINNSLDMVIVSPN